MLSAPHRRPTSRISEPSIFRLERSFPAYKNQSGALYKRKSGKGITLVESTSSKYSDGEHECPGNDTSILSITGSCRSVADQHSIPHTSDAISYRTRNDAVAMDILAQVEQKRRLPDCLIRRTKDKETTNKRQACESLGEMVILGRDLTEVHSPALPQQDDAASLYPPSWATIHPTAGCTRRGRVIYIKAVAENQDTARVGQAV